jgi:6-phosphogluconate dehydrogenase
VPHGEPTERVCSELRVVLERGDIVADYDNSHPADSRRRHAMFSAAGLRFLDVGTSGGLAGARHGAAFLAGGEAATFEIIRPLLVDLAVDKAAVCLAGPAGAGLLSNSFITRSSSA